MNGKTSIVDKAIVCGRTYAAQLGQAAILFVRRVSAVSKKFEKMEKMSSPVPVHPLLYAASRLRKLQLSLSVCGVLDF